MSKLKSLFAGIVVALVAFIAVGNVSALTKTELDTIDFRRHFLDTFEEGSLTRDEQMVAYAVAYGDIDEQFETQKVSSVTDAYTEYSVEEKDFEDYIKTSFNVNETDLERIRSTSIQMDTIYDAKYDNGYYYYQIYGSMGFGVEDYEAIKGYKALDNNIYQIYAFVAEELDKESNEQNAEYVVSNGVTYKITYYYMIKVQYDGKNIKYLAYQEIDKASMPKDSELILYSDLSDKVEFVGAPLSFDISKEENLTFKIDAAFELFDKVYLDNKEVDKKNYTAKSGSTIITFNDAYTKTLSTGKHTLEVSFTDGTSATTTFTINKTQIANNPDTAINFGYGALALIAVISGSLYFLVRKRTKFAKHN